MEFFEICLVSPEEASYITHGGVFHADDVMATAILSALGPVNLCRTFKVPDNTDAFVFDVGGGAYDHHQPGGNGNRPNGVPYASAGLIWREMGRLVVSCDRVWEQVDRDLISGIDAVDNGMFPKVDFPAGLQSMATLIHAFNPNWDDERSQDEAFLEAVKFAQGVLARTIESAESKARAKSIVDEAITESQDQVIILSKFAPWQEYVLTSEKPQAKDALYVIFPSIRGGYNVQAIPLLEDGFNNRKPFPVSWRGLSGAELATETGVKEAIFCHKGGFICGAETLEGAKALAQTAIKA